MVVSSRSILLMMALTTVVGLQSAAQGEITPSADRVSVVQHFHNSGCKIHYDSIDVYVAKLVPSPNATIPGYQSIEAVTNSATGVRIWAKYLYYDNDEWRIAIYPDYEDRRNSAALDVIASMEEIDLLFSHVNAFSELLPWIVNNNVLAHGVNDETCAAIAEQIERNPLFGRENDAEGNWIYDFLVAQVAQVLQLIPEYSGE
ncbi:hypothetical protein FOZ63_020810 [Perkinsus olseni]|uniref:Uncharacterized protein n=1 Tax=Perkinsus olseni TaxID=32597 RepID=A0A7J6UK73_PEROL|nr:hypothetical protein FOZ62_026741 [Perkinsus olseni]KAF4757593.1 hypothetical protein FOZ63_020810 [Perkinsus olseni]